MSKSPTDHGKIDRKTESGTILSSEPADPRVEALVNQLIGRVADKWTMLVLEELANGEELRFTELGRRVSGISQKMLTQTLRQMERDGLVIRTIHPVIPPKVEYRLTHLGLSLGEAFCGVWIWAEQNLDEIEAARLRFDERRQRAETSAARA
jgi:DNA-binding HxlR family transcriptional regulator